MTTTPSIEIVWSQEEATYGGAPMMGDSGTIYDPWRHYILPHCHWVEVLKANLDLPDLFMFFHKQTAAFVLASWIYRPDTGQGPGLMTELEVLSGHPDHLGDVGPEGLPHLEYLRTRCCSAQEMRDRVGQKVRRIMYNRRKDLEEDAIARKEYAGHLRRQYNDPNIAKSIENGSPWVRPDKIDDADWKKYAKLAEAL